MATGLLDYFPEALAAVASLSHGATAQHHPGAEMHWDRTKSQDHADCIVRHLVDRGTYDHDGARHSAKVAWRALAMLQMELESDWMLGLPRGAKGPQPANLKAQGSIAEGYILNDQRQTCKYCGELTLLPCKTIFESDRCKSCDA